MNVLDADPEKAWVIEGLCGDGRLVPMMVPTLESAQAAGWSRTVLNFVPERRAGNTPLPDPFLAEDFVVGMELLGFRFAIGEMGGKPMLLRMFPDSLPASWERFAMRLLAAVADRPGHVAETIAFLREREARS